MKAKRRTPKLLKIGNCLFCGKPLGHETHHRVNDKRNHTFVDPEPTPKKLTPYA